MFIIYFKGIVNKKYKTFIYMSGIYLIRHTKGPEKCVGLYRMSGYPGFILVNKNILGPLFFVGCHRMLENSGVGLHKVHCIFIKLLISSLFPLTLDKSVEILVCIHDHRQVTLLVFS